MSDTQNQWIPVSERLPDKSKRVLARISTGALSVAYIGACSDEWTVPGVGLLDDSSDVTHWMDLPEPPAPPKPADPFEAWLDKQRFRDTHLNKACFYTPYHQVLGVNTAKWVWDAAKEHYAKPLPDFETWWRNQPACGSVRTMGYHNVKDIWNAAQGKPEA